MLFLAFKIWVRINFSIKVTCKKNFNISCRFYLTWRNIWQFWPWWQWVFWNKISVLIDARCTLCIESRFFFFTVGSIIIPTFNLCLNNIVVILCSCDFAKESSLRGIEFSGKFFQGLLKSVSFLFSKTYTCPWKYSLRSI